CRELEQPAFLVLFEEASSCLKPSGRGFLRIVSASDIHHKDKDCMIEHDGAISPANTLFVLLCFEGPDVYSTAGGLGTRVSELSEALAAQGYETHLIFIGD